MEYLKIREFADAIGVSVSTVRKYEQDKVLMPHHRTMSNQRIYTTEQVTAYINGDFNNPILKGK